MRIAEITKDEYLNLDLERVVPVIPLGSIEQHGAHLPMGTDSQQCEAIVARAEAALPEAMLVTPVLWIGNSVNHLGFDAALYLDPTRYVTLLVDIARCFIERGFRHVLFVNGHGANAGPLMTALHQIEYDYIRKNDELQIAAVTWWNLDLDAITEVRESPPGAAGHACEIETSVMLATNPSLVRMQLAADGALEHPHPRWGSHDFTGVSRASFVEMFHRAAPNGVAGLPTLGTADKGEIIVERVAGKLVEFVADFGTW